MFIKKVTIKNFRLFKVDPIFNIDKINVPDNNNNEGSGLTVIVGENGCGKSALLEAIVLPLIKFRADAISLSDFNDPNEKVLINDLANTDFGVSGTMPRGSFQSKGFSFEASIRSRANKSYLSSLIVSDQKFIKADGEPKPDKNSPDLRVNVNNPFKGKRFNENDILFLDKNRTYQTRSGTYNPTRFDRLMEDFNYQYIKNREIIEDICEKINDIQENIENNFLDKTIEKFAEISGSNISLNIIDNWQPFYKSFFAEKKENNQQILLNMVGSGYEMIFSLLYSFYLSQQSGKDLIILIDEPELHLHPKLQEDFVKILLEFSKEAQIILTTHSPLFVKQVLCNEKVQVNILKKENKDDNVKISKIDERILPYLSANEINFIAFGLATEEYHNELFEELYESYKQTTNNENLSIKDFDIHFFQNEKQESVNYPYNNTANQVSIHTHLRTQIHHRGSSGKPDFNDINNSIKKMREYLKGSEQL